jgi:hypothetical protein
MIDELASELVEFPGAANRTRCFTHILNLVVKSVMRQFDVPSRKNNRVTDERTHDLMKLAGDIESEELMTQIEQDDVEDPDDGPHPDNDEGWIDERDDMTDEEVEDLEDNVQVSYLEVQVSYQCGVHCLCQSSQVCLQVCLQRP